MLKMHPLVFQGVGHRKVVHHSINTGDAAPICVPSHRTPVNLLGKARTQIKKMHEERIVRKSNNPWCSPVVLVQKKNGDVRIAMDYRALNGVTRRDAR